MINTLDSGRFGLSTASDFEIWSFWNRLLWKAFRAPRLLISNWSTIWKLAKDINKSSHFPFLAPLLPRPLKDRLGLVWEWPTRLRLLFSSSLLLAASLLPGPPGPWSPPLLAPPAGATPPCFSSGSGSCSCGYNQIRCKVLKGVCCVLPQVWTFLLPAWSWW